MFMHLGTFASFNREKHKNIIYIVLDNESYESTGGQKTTFNSLRFSDLAKTFGFENVVTVKNKKGLEIVVENALKSKSSTFIHIKVKQDNNAVSKRVSDKYSCPQIKDRFMASIKIK